MNGSKLLTIYIPTYNRPKQIQKQVRTILPQLKEEIVLIVNDNCSQIDVATLFSKEEKDLFLIKKNRVNIGGDANIIRGFESCKTKWLWVLGDDDFILPSSLSLVLKKIKEYPDYLWMNFECGKNIKFNSNIDFFHSIENAREFGNSFWISKCVYNMENLLPYIGDYYSVLNSMIGQLGILLFYAIDHDNFKGQKFKNKIFELNEPGGWPFERFIQNTPILFQAKKINECKIINYTVKKGYTNQCITMVTEDMPHRISTLYNILSRYGWCNSFKSFPLLILRKFVVLILPKTLIKTLRKLNKK